MESAEKSPMNICLFFEGTGQGVAGKATNVTRLRDLCIDDERQTLHLETGDPSKVVDPLGRETAFCYNSLNVLESTTDADGIVTKYTYSKAGLVSKVERVLSGETLSSVSIAYDGTAYFNDMLGTTLAAVGGGKAEPFGLTAFGGELPGEAAPSPFFTGKPRVDGLGHVFLMRNYRSELGKWLTGAPMGYPDGWIQLAYCGNGVVLCVDIAGGETILIVCSSTNSDPVSSGIGAGHSWIEIVDTDAHTRTTYGTWGNTDPQGLRINGEINYKSEASRAVILNDSQLKAMQDKILEYSERKEDAWSKTEPCSDFAVAVWLAATEEDLSCGNVLTTPSELKSKIIEKNGGKTCAILE